MIKVSEIKKLFNFMKKNSEDENINKSDNSKNAFSESINNNVKEKKFGTCKTCKEYNSSYSWCQKCDPPLLTQGWTSGNEALDELIKSTQLEAERYENEYYFQWIDYDDLEDIDKISEGGFSAIYKATWAKGYRYIHFSLNKRIMKDRVVVLKRLKNSQIITDEFLNEFKNYIKFYKKINIIHIFGLSQDPITKEYIFVMEYIREGSLHDYLEKDFENLKWKEKMEITYSIVNGLEKLHEQGIIHRDLHGGNVLCKKQYEFIYSYIADLGLSCNQESLNNRNTIFGVFPYVAPEVLRNEPYTAASDIYSFGVLMSLISTGQRPFKDVPHNTDLAIAICRGLRPGFSKNTPKFFIKMAYRCMDANPRKRPTAEKIRKAFVFWKGTFNKYLMGMDEHIYYTQEQLDELKSIRKEINEMDKIKLDSSTTIAPTIHPNVSYTSRLLNFSNLPEPVNKDQLIDNYSDSHQIDLIITDEFLK